MGLGIGVGLLVAARGIDPEGEKYLRSAFATINRVLKKNGLPPHHEPETLTPLNNRSSPTSVGYFSLPYFARAIAYARQAPQEFHPVKPGSDPADDPHLDYERSIAMDSHIICHSDCEGFYVPIDFRNPIYDDAVVGDVLGSSPRVLAELLLAAPLLEIPIRRGKLSNRAAAVIAKEEDNAHPCWRERRVWLKFFEAARLSVESGTAIMFG